MSDDYQIDILQINDGEFHVQMKTKLCGVKFNDRTNEENRN